MARRTVGAGLVLVLAATPLAGCAAVLGIEDAEYRGDATVDGAEDAAEGGVVVDTADDVLLDTGADDTLADTGDDVAIDTGLDGAVVDTGGDAPLDTRVDGAIVDTAVDAPLDTGADVTLADGGDASDAKDAGADAPPDANPCNGVTCASPPVATCTSATTRRTYSATGTCSGGTCSYAPSDTACAFGCSGANCNVDPCLGVTCASPPPASCADGTTRRSYGTPGTCSTGACTYPPTDTPCPSAPPPTCADATTLRTFAGGACAAGVCSNRPTDSPCLGGWICTAGACTAPTAPTSCIGGGDGRSNCGPSGTESCCTSLLVSGNTTPSFSRSYDGVSSGYLDPQYLAQVTDFRLDKYEITVGRFRQYVDAVVAGWTPSAGAGKHTHLNGGNGLAATGYEPGWDAASWNTAANFPTSKATWDGASYLTSPNCTVYPTWTPSAGSNERKPINCLDWFDAAAFCIWDGGFLPSEAEWNYAASGGTEQRVYPWGPAAPGPNTSLAIYGCYYNGTGPGSCSGSTNVAPVGSAPAGNGKYGHSDLAGNVGEWTLDFYKSPYAESTIVDRAYLKYVAGMGRVMRGGAFSSGAGQLLTGFRVEITPTSRTASYGARCARTP